jgi:hypothetical protein
LKTSDCVVRAIATATNTDYMEVRWKLNHKKRELGYTSYKDTKFLYDYFKGYPRLIFRAIKDYSTIKGSDFTELHPKRTYILKMAGHITACVAGFILGTWDCSYRTVYTTWEIK